MLKDTWRGREHKEECSAPSPEYWNLKLIGMLNSARKQIRLPSGEEEQKEWNFFFLKKKINKRLILTESNKIKIDK